MRLSISIYVGPFEFQITYHQESEVQVTKLGEGPNSLVSSDEGLPTTRLKCFPLYSVLLAYSATTLDYLSLDSPDAQDGQVTIDFTGNYMKFYLQYIYISPRYFVLLFFFKKVFPLIFIRYDKHVVNMLERFSLPKISLFQIFYFKYFPFTVIVFGVGPGYDSLGDDQDIRGVYPLESSP